jgi:hypothetical protein
MTIYPLLTYFLPEVFDFTSDPVPPLWPLFNVQAT